MATLPALLLECIAGHNIAAGAIDYYMRIKTGTHYKTSLPLQETPLVATMIAVLETIGQLRWKLIHLGWYGIIAHIDKATNGKVQEVIVRWEGGNLMVRSDNTTISLSGRKKNRDNVTDFLAAFHDVRQHVTEEYAIEVLQTRPLHFAHPYHDILSPRRFAQIGRRDNPLKIFLPVEGYFITPLLLITNILVFVLMGIAGADLLDPGSRVIHEWGGNFGPAIRQGEWWRLISAVFVHIGIVHLLANMLTLGFIGFALEPLLGRARFLTAYLLSGITGGLLSMSVHPHIISAGASGAIFGMFGVFLAVLSTSLTEAKMRNVAFPSMVLYVLYQLAAGMKDGVDNAGHLGGLLGGLVIGYALYPSLKNPDSRDLKFQTLAVLGIIVVLLAAWVISAA